ncbi:MAG: D-glycero-beta-D-manno-heptose-7-phosphate kinase [Candidatus Latescibacterota bacterium]|jgi:D-beta-D-heptose 7-phosphate kinase/D-beta-D-heptose 1-phosphate adenosyltransferase|nr:MAG: D-glycero-beta-D-manno-heptose-7-phosphate kinase [Candidatus Latescibacterota bacterium]
MRRKRVREICREMKRARVAVVGDLMLDRYIWGQVERISPEAPVPVVAVAETSVRLGGAANVAWNLASLGVRANLAGVVGKDASGGDLRRMLREKGISTASLVADPGRPTTEKIRIVAHNQQVVRADIESGAPFADDAAAKLLAAVRRSIAGVRVVIVSDYGKGVVTPAVMDLLRARNMPFLIDPKEGHFSLYRGALAVTPNKKEAGGFYNRKIRTDDELELVGTSLVVDLDAAAVLVTRGEEGMTLFEPRKKPRHFPTRASEVYDVTGAGDTVISVLGAGLAAGATLYESIELANAAAGIVIKELGTAAARAEELEEAFA